MATNHHPRPAPANPAPTGHVSAGEIAQFLHHLARTHTPAQGGDPADHAALLARKADLPTRIANQHDALTDPEQARHIAELARTQAAAAARHAENPETDDTTNVKDLTSPTSPRQGISLSNTAESRRASSTPSNSSGSARLATASPPRCAAPCLSPWPPRP